MKIHTRAGSHFSFLQ